MSSTAIKVENLGKAYNIQHKQGGYVALRDIITDTLRNPTQLFKPNQTKQEVFWALKNVSFELQQGEVLGVIGRNGAGKSTLLKLLSRITAPTTGKISINGRVASLLEVGTGFHPELTGRENIYLSGTILGMKRHEITQRFDQIVDFAGIEQFLDTPVKRYSSGMYVRLGFSIAAHLDPDILLVDEVLAVGDAEFQKKSLTRMNSVAQEGRTVIFVSHNLGMIKQLCPQSILLQKGELTQKGNTQQIVSLYEQSLQKIKTTKKVNYRGQLKNDITLYDFTLNDKSVFESSILPLSSLNDIKIAIRLKVNTPNAFQTNLAIYSQNTRIFTLQDSAPSPTNNKEFTATFTIPATFLRPGIYTIGFGISETEQQRQWAWIRDFYSIQIVEEYTDTILKQNFGIINLNAQTQRIIHEDTTK